MSDTATIYATGTSPTVHTPEVLLGILGDKGFIMDAWPLVMGEAGTARCVEYQLAIKPVEVSSIVSDLRLNGFGLLGAMN